MRRNAFSDGAKWLRAGTAAVVALLAGCGSTVQWSTELQDDTDGVVAGDEFSEPSDEGPLGRSDTADEALSNLASQEGRSDVTAVPGDRSVRDIDGGTTVPGGRLPSNTALPDHSGITNEVVYVGYGILTGAEETAGSYGFEFQPGDQERIARTMANDINSRGGIGGRKVELVFHRTSTQEFFSNPDAAYQRACSHWTEDRPVFVAMMDGAMNGSNDTFLSCMSKRHTVVMGGGFRPESFWDRYSPYVYGSNSTSVDRWSKGFIPRLVARDYFEDWDADPRVPGPEAMKIGILGTRDADGQAYIDIVTRELGRHGMTVTSTYMNSGDLSRAAQESNQAVLRFRSAGVTHVFIDVSVLTFYQASKSQDYRPRWAFPPVFPPNVVSGSQWDDQVKGAMGTSTSPRADAHSSQKIGDISPAETRCRKLYEDDGHDTNPAPAYRNMMSTCDRFNLLKRAVDKKTLSIKGLRDGLAGTGRVPGALTMEMSFPDGRFDGSNRFRDVSYRLDCSCFWIGSTNHAF